MSAPTHHAGDSVVVIGTGPCGAMAAAVLAGAGVDVTLVDSGMRPPRGLTVKAAGNTLFRWTPKGDLQWDGFVRGGHPHTEWHRDLSPGGLSNHWTAAVPRFAPEDFTEGERIDVRYRWPIGYDDLEPHFETAERYLKVSASGRAARNLPANRVAHARDLAPEWRAVAAGADRLGHGVTPMPMAAGARWGIRRSGTDFNSYSDVVAPLLGQPNVRMVDGAHALRLVWSAAQGRVTRLEYLDRRSNTVVGLHGRAFVVAAGTLSSTRLLLASRSDDFPTGLGDTHGVLGKYLHDHPREWWLLRTDRPLRLPMLPVYMTRHDPADSEPLLATSWTIGLPSTKHRLRTLYRGRGRLFGVGTFGTMVPTPDNVVSSGEGDLDRFGQPRLHVRIAFDDVTVKNLLGARDRMRDVMGEAGISAAVDAPDGADHVYPGTSKHYGGTVRMHDDPQFGMLDRWNRMHAAPNVVVCDPSSFTTGPEKNPTLTAMAIAARAARRLADESR